MRRIVEIPTGLYQIIVQAAVESNVERCGILIGYRDNNKYVITHVLEDETATNRSYVGVTRNIQGVWEDLNSIAQDYSPSDYIGEWHTHPSGLQKPSFIDIVSMLSIVGSVEYGSLKEILLLLGLPNIGCQGWLFSNDRVSKLLLRVITDEIESSK